MLQTVGVIGGGTMGAGIAQVAAAAGCSVLLLERDQQLARRAVDRILVQFSRLAEKGKMSPPDSEAAASRIRAASGAADLAGCALVIEAVFEDLSAKHAVLHDVASAIDASTVQRHDDAIFATNTSSLSVAEIASGLPRPERMVGMHFFNPAPLMPLVEVIAAERSDPTAVERVFQTALAWGKTAVRARDVPGFIVNRVARPYYLEALRLLGDGDATIAEIDVAMRALGFRMGPFELMDLVGIDVNYAVSCSVHDRLGRPERLRPHEIQRLMVEAGTLGRKTGCGFYDYQGESPTPLECRIAGKSGMIAAFRSSTIDSPNPLMNFAGPSLNSAYAPPPITLEPKAGPSCGLIQTRILFAVLNEAARAVNEQVATPSDVDLAMTNGTNYPFGPINWAQRLGIDRVRQGLLDLTARYGQGYAPAGVFAR